jgi:hypothetical protein
LTRYSFCFTVIIREPDIGKVLSTDKKIAVFGSLAEGSRIQSIERITGVHRDTIMRLGVKVRQGCTALMDAKMRNLSYRFVTVPRIRPALSPLAAVRALTVQEFSANANTDAEA